MIRVLWVVLGLNLAVCVGKAAVGLATGSMALLADSVHSLLDASSNVVGLVGIAIASRPPSETHPYGHRRFEALSALAIGLFIAAGLVEIVRNVVGAALGDHPPPDVGVGSIAFVALTLVVNVAISRLEARKGEELRSTLLTADASHTMSDAAASAVVLASFVGVWFGITWADLAAAAVVAVLVGRAALHVLAENLQILTDRAQLDPVRVHAAAMAVPGVRDAHHIRSRGMPGDVEVDLRIHLDPELPLSEAHALCHRVGAHLREVFPEITDTVIHPEPTGEHEVTTLAPGVDAEAALVEGRDAPVPRTAEGDA